MTFAISKRAFIWANPSANASELSSNLIDNSCNMALSSVDAKLSFGWHFAINSFITFHVIPSGTSSLLPCWLAKWLLSWGISLSVLQLLKQCSAFLLLSFSCLQLDYWDPMFWILVRQKVWSFLVEGTAKPLNISINDHLFCEYWYGFFHPISLQFCSNTSSTNSWFVCSLICATVNSICNASLSTLQYEFCFAHFFCCPFAWLTALSTYFKVFYKPHDSIS